MSSERENPWVTPRIMLATSVRVRPWSSRERRESLGRSTRTWPFSTVTFISRSSFCATLPLGPSTFTRPGWAVTLTLSGILMASLPMRDMAAPYQTVAISSPPRCCLRASRSTSTPLEVERMAIPRPFITLGISVYLTYRRRPGLDWRRISLMAGRRPSSYLSRTFKVPCRPSSARDTSRTKPSSRSTSQIFCLMLLAGRSISSSPARCAEGHAEIAQQSAALFVAPRRGHDGDVHALDLLDPVVVDLGKDDLLLDTERVVALAVEALRPDALEVAHAGQRDVQQAVEELVHPVLAQRGHHADRLVLAQLEVRDALAGPRDHRLLPGDRHHLLLGLLDQLVVGDRLAEAHVDDDLLDLGHLRRVLVAELLHQGRGDLVLVGDAQAGRVLTPRRSLAFRGLDGLRALLLLAALLLAAAAGLLRLGVDLGVGHRPFAVSVLLGLVVLLLLVVCHGCSLRLIDLRAAALRDAHALAVLQQLRSDAGGLLRVRIDQRQVGDVDAAVLLHDPALRRRRVAAPLVVPLERHQLLHDGALLVVIDLKHLAQIGRAH